MTTTIWEKVEDALDSLSTPFKADVYLPEAGGALPNAFMTYSLVSSVPLQHANGAETERMYRVQVSYYSKSGLLSMPDINGVMVTAGFMAGPKTSIAYNQQTGHYGLALEFVYEESEG